MVSVLFNAWRGYFWRGHFSSPVYTQTEYPFNMLVDELYMAMLEVGLSARRHKIPALDLIDTAQKSLDLWRRDEKAAFRFARMVRVTTG